MTCKHVDCSKSTHYICISKYGYADTRLCVFEKPVHHRKMHHSYVHHRFMYGSHSLSVSQIFIRHLLFLSTHFESHPAKHTFIVSNFYQNSLGSSKLNCQPLFTLSAGQFLLTTPKTLLSALTLIPYDILNVFTSSQNHCFQKFRTFIYKIISYKYMRLGPPHHHAFSFQLISCLGKVAKKEALLVVIYY